MAFFWQTPGAMAPYAVALVLLALIGPEQCPYYSSESSCVGAAEKIATDYGVAAVRLSADMAEGVCEWDATGSACSFSESSSTFYPYLQFRVILGFGAIPAAVVMISAMCEARQEWPEATIEDDHAAREERETAGVGPLQQLRENPRYWGKLAGTAGTWFLYDISYYGTAVFLPAIQMSIFGEGESLRNLSWQSLGVSACGLLGTCAAVSLLPKKGTKWLNLVGFYCLASMFGLMAATYLFVPAEQAEEVRKPPELAATTTSEPPEVTWLQWLLFFELGVLTLLLNFGPNVATFVLPAVAFPPEVRSTFHGISAGAGKLGAVVGVFIFPPIADTWGVPAVMTVQALLSLVAAAVTRHFIDDDYPNSTNASVAASSGRRDDEGANLVRRSNAGTAAPVAYTRIIAGNDPAPPLPDRP